MRLKMIIPAAVVVLLGGLLVFGPGGAHANWNDLLWRMITFVFFAGIIWWAAGKKIMTLLQDRRDGIAGDFDSLEQARRDAEFALHQLSARIANLDLEREALLAESKTQAEAARDQILAQARRQADEILAQAERTAENEARIMVRALRARLADDVAAAVRDQLAGRLDAAEHDRLIDNALKKVVIQ
ncbi:MAG: ATP synthase F0 subunit B [Deltaproteobacteria bacterium]|jgi:F-type H+-transporting ATPase subunit b|nr:ATP synthase F0 subunit B [Deltaproteobacteria bacterium]